jgi:hypothetical protein
MGPSRRRLPGSELRRKVEGVGRALGRGAVALLAQMSEDGDAAAEYLLAHAPRLFMRKGAPVELQLCLLADGELERTKLQSGSRTPYSAEQGWAAAVEGALEEGSLKRLLRVVEAGPRERTTGASIDELHALYPEQQVDLREAERWKTLRERIPAERNPWTLADLRKWARKHPTSSGGRCGWTGALLSQIIDGDPDVGATLARLWARPPAEWNWRGCGDTVMRRADGWTLPKGTGWRPIAAPSVVRRVGSAVMMRRAMPLCERYCRQRGQVGLSGEAYTIAYSMLPLLVERAGGTVLIGDRSNSFQTLRRDAVFLAVEDVVRSAVPSEAAAAAALVDACVDYYADATGVSRTSVTLRWS